MRSSKIRGQGAITQKILAEFLDSLRALSEAKQRHEGSRLSLLERFEAGAEVEPGPLSVRVTSVEIRRFGRDALRAILGRDEVERLHALLTTRVVRRVDVWAAGAGYWGRQERDD